MTSYPTGVQQNHAAPGSPPDLRPVGEQNWRMFSTRADAKRGLEMIQTVVPDAAMRDETEGQYAQFHYEDSDPDIRVRGVHGTVVLKGETLRIQEYPSDILDRSRKPQPVVDKYSEGQPHHLAVSQISSDLGQLYWSA